MKHYASVVQFSTGAGSAEVLLREVAEFGAKHVLALTADTLVEDEDNWRFARQVIEYVGCRWVTIAEGRTPMKVGLDRRIVPNNRAAICSRILKRELLREWIEDNCDPSVTKIALGFDWTEEHRYQAAIEPWRPYTVRAPLMVEPFVTKADILDAWRQRGIEAPRLYAQGFSHANCGGGCVRGGQAQWRLLLRVNRDRYLEWEAGEEAIRTKLDKDVSILRDRTDATTTPVSLRQFRERLDTQPSLFDSGDWGACDCMTADIDDLDEVAT